ncbi:MAG TPA: class I adenylate-forming enzyme family protein [Pseudonocardiaceae bacterium]
MQGAIAAGDPALTGAAPPPPAGPDGEPAEIAATGPVAGTEPTPAGWVDEVLLGGADGDVCLVLGREVTRGELRALVAEQQHRLTEAGLTAGGTLALRLPPSLGYVALLLAGWRAGAQVSLLDHRLTQHEVDRALDRVGAQFLVRATETVGHRLRGYAEVTTEVVAREDGRPAATAHSLVQFSSGSTGASKVIARTAADLIAELGRYAVLDGYPARGERVVLLASIVHVLGLVGGLLHALHAGVVLHFPERLTADGILGAVAGRPEPATVLGVPFHAELLLGAADDTPTPAALRRMVVAGELVRPAVPPRFTARFGVPLGTMYGMTEYGVIATDLDGTAWPSVVPTAGTRVRADRGELLLGMAASPYLGLSDPTRFADGWLRTRDAATVGPDGTVTILGRLDSQVSIGGLKVDLTEVEQALAGMPEVAEVVVLHDGDIEAYLALADGGTADAVRAALARELAPFKRPRRMHVVPQLPRTATGKIVRDPAALRPLARTADPREDTR